MTARRRARSAVVVAAVAVVIATVAGCGSAAPGATGSPTADPTASVAASPDYTQACALSGLDDQDGCLRVTLQAIDDARAKEHLGPLRLPASYGAMPFAEQVLAVVDAERTSRGLAPVAGTTAALDADAQRGADVDDLPPGRVAGVTGVQTDAIAGLANPLDADYTWLYDDGPGSGTPGCDRNGDPGCWLDRRFVLGRYPSGPLVLGAAVDPTGDTQSYDRGGPSMAVVLGAATAPAPAVDAALTVTWSAVEAAAAKGTLSPLRSAPDNVSLTGIPNPPHTEPPDPDYTKTCAPSGLDDSAACLAAEVAAVDRARAAEGVKPMVLPPDFASLPVPAQLFVVVDLERVDRGLAPFVGLSTSLDANAAKGASAANDPPDPSGSAILGDDEEWSGGSLNGLDADYGWMYDDGRGSGNLDCPRRGGSGCWGHREGILDAFGTVGTMVMGAAYDPTGDTAASGWAGGTSMAVTLVATLSPPASYQYSWPQVLDGSSP